MQKTPRFYRNIIYNDSKGAKNIICIRKEYKTWIKLIENTKYWLDKIQNKTPSIIHVQGADHFRDVVMTQIDGIKEAEEESKEKTGDVQEQNEDDEVQNMDTQHQP